jgi:2-polyprenyl-6-methoxyphenol hydroxylase-like FAD-dependent oxidoreductase
MIDRIEDQGRWDRFEIVHLQRWSKGRVAVIGDAAHAQPPNLGQGGACAMMTGLALGVHLARATTIEAGLNSWEETERDLIEHTQRVSWLYGAVTTWPPAIRTAALGLLGRSRRATKQRLRAAAHLPTGTH